jgi:xylose isomerase
VHLNDQNGLKYDQDKSFGAVDLRRAFNQVWVLERGGYSKSGGVVGLDVKAMRTTMIDKDASHLSNSREFFLMMVELVRSIDAKAVEGFRQSRDYEGLERYIIRKLMGKE